MATHTERLHLTIDDQVAQRYYPVPVAVPAGAPSMSVRLSYDTDRGVVDLGCEGPEGWRGWSGGARDRFTITTSEATPGYLPGELEGGTWQVVLGLHQLPAEGLEVTVEVSSPAAEPPERERRAAPEPPGARGSERDVPGPG